MCIGGGVIFLSCNFKYLVWCRGLRGICYCLGGISHVSSTRTMDHG